MTDALILIDTLMAKADFCHGPAPNVVDWPMDCSHTSGSSKGPIHFVHAASEYTQSTVGPLLQPCLQLSATCLAKKTDMRSFQRNPLQIAGKNCLCGLAD